MCPRCSSSETSSRSRRTSTGYRTFACRACGTVFNERTGTPFNDLQYPSDVVMLAVLLGANSQIEFPSVDAQGNSLSGMALWLCALIGGGVTGVMLWITDVYTGDGSK